MADDFSVNPPVPNPDLHTKTYRLSKYDLLRYDVTGTGVSIELTEGTAELFGTELVLKHPVPLHPGDLGSVLTFSGATIAVHTTSSAKPESTESAVVAFVTSSEEDQGIANIYLNIHAGLERMRTAALADQLRGPRVLVCGQESVGKATLCRTLVSYAARKGRKTILVDVNVGLSQTCLPGTLTALAITKPYDLQEGWSLEEDPMVFSFGHLDPGMNLDLYRDQVHHLADLVNIRSENDTAIFANGCIINMCGFKKDQRDSRIKAIQMTALAFEVDHILVIEDGFLESSLRKDLPSQVVIARLPKSSAAHTRSMEQWACQRDALVHAYFHGTGPRKLQPHHLTVPANMYGIYKVGVAAISDSLLPHGEAQEEDPWRKPVPVRISQDLTNRLLAISQAEEPEHLPDSPVYGFVVVLSVADDKSTITLMAPSSTPPPGCFLLYTDIQYVDPERLD